MKSIFITCTLAIGLLLTPTEALIAQSSLPSLGDDSSLSLGAERRMGDEIARAIYKDPEYVSDPILDAYMARIMQPLYAAAKRRGELSPEMNEQFAWRVFLIRDKSINAFALPGGYLGVHLGLLALVDTPDELASVMAHEITHVTQRHIARGMSKQAAATPWLIAGILVGLLAARTNDNVASAAIATTQAGSVQNQLNFTRDMEREADRIGLTLMEPAGYAPRGFIAMFDKLGFASRLADNGSFPYLRSHPLTTDRLADMTNRIGEFNTRQDPNTVSVASTNALELHRLMAARARALSDLGRDAQKLLLARAERLEGESSQHMALLYAGTLAALQLKMPEKTKQLYAQLDAKSSLQSAEVRHVIRLLAAQITSVKLSLGSENRAEMLQAAEEMNVSKQAELVKAVTERLRTWTGAHPQDADAWRLLAASYSTLGQRVRAAMAQAELQRSQIDHTAALASYLAAQSMIRQGQSADVVDIAIADSKVRELQRLVRERLP